MFLLWDGSRHGTVKDTEIQLRRVEKREWGALSEEEKRRLNGAKDLAINLLETKEQNWRYHPVSTTLMAPRASHCTYQSPCIKYICWLISFTSVQEAWQLKKRELHAASWVGCRVEHRVFSNKDMTWVCWGNATNGGKMKSAHTALTQVGRDRIKDTKMTGFGKNNSSSEIKE